jgi:hypothetical protein
VGTLLGQLVSAAQLALVVDPSTKPHAILSNVRRNAAVSLASHEPLQQAEVELPRRGGLLDQPCIESVDEFSPDSGCRYVELDLAWTPRR